MKGINHEPHQPESTHHLPSEADPAIYAASLADYNHGYLHGRWVSANQEPGDMQAEIDAMLAESLQPLAEEWAIHDYQGFGSFAIHEYERLEDVARLGQGIVEHGLAYAAWAEVAGIDQLGVLAFEQHYRGHWTSLKDWAQNYLDDMGVDQANVTDRANRWLSDYVRLDVDAFARDMTDTIQVVDDPDGGIYIFDPPGSA